MTDSLQRTSPEIESAVICALIDASKKHVIKLHEHDIGILARAIVGNLTAMPYPVSDDGRIKSFPDCPACANSSSSGGKRSCTAAAGCFHSPGHAQRQQEPLDFFTKNVDAWGAAEWFDRLARAIRQHDAAVLTNDEAVMEICRNVAASSAMRLVRDYEQQVRAALSVSSTDREGK